MGYPQGTKGFKILDIEHGKIAISRDVKFVENNFPFAHLKSKNPISEIFEVPMWHEDDYVKQTEAENVTADSVPQTEPTQSTTTHAPTDFVDFGGDIQVEDDTVIEKPHNESQTPRSTRVKLPSSRLQNYEVTLPPSVDHARPVPDRTSSTVHSLSNYVSYNNFSASHMAFLAAVTSVNEPKSFKEAMQDKNWRDAMQREIKALEDNETWTLETLPEGKHAIDSKWVYKIKYKPTGEIERYKARLVARGFTQIEGVDYHDTFAPVAKLVTIRTLITVAVKKNWLLHQLDANNAFLHGDLQEEVYMKIPQGFSNNEETRVCRLRKSLYGLKQVSRTWYQKFTVSLLEIGYKHAFPMEQNLKLDQCHESHKTDASLYRRLIGRLLYLQATRPDIAYAVNILSQFVSDPRVDHMNAVLRVLRYIKSTLGQGIFIPKSGGFNLVAYCDADWLGCPYTRHSRTGYLLLLGGVPVSWKTKKQSVVSRSSAEAEYRAMATTVSEILWMRWLLKDLTVNLQDATPLYCDNQAARHIANNPVFHERTKHVEMDCYFVRERVASQEILPLHVTSKQQIADLFTKPLGAQTLRVLLGKLGVQDLHTPA
ncbi:integrase [Tanacetum coccineum]